MIVSDVGAFSRYPVVTTHEHLTAFIASVSVRRLNSRLHDAPSLPRFARRVGSFVGWLLGRNALLGGSGGSS